VLDAVQPPRHEPLGLADGFDSHVVGDGVKIKLMVILARFGAMQ